MKLFIKILLFALVALITNVNIVSATINPFTGKTISPSNPWWHISVK